VIPGQGSPLRDPDRRSRSGHSLCSERSSEAFAVCLRAQLSARVGRVAPMPVEVMTDTRQYLAHLGWQRFVFPSKRSPSGHIPPDMPGQWLLAAQVEAKLPKLERGLCIRTGRRRAKERMHRPLETGADAGGWKDVASLMKRYEHADDLLRHAVMTNQPTQNPARLTDGAGPYMT
jgi:hypothetical protein